MSDSPFVRGRSGEEDDGIWNLRDLEEKVLNPSQWGTIGTRCFKAFAISHKVLPPGCYGITIDRNDDRPIFTGKYIKSDEILRFKGGMVDDLLNDINSFWEKGDVFKKNGFLHSRGFLLYGSQGTGKSSIVWQVADDVIRRGGVVFVCDNPKFFSDGLKTFRLVEPDRPIVCVFEDIDAIIAKYGESEILAVLDGDNQIDKVINIATTNYPENLDKRIVSRPRRFDRIIKVYAPDVSIVRKFLRKKLPKKDVETWVKKTQGLSFAAISECLISVLCLENDLDETIAILRDIESKTPKSSDFGTGLGFSADSDEPKKGRGRKLRRVELDL